MIAWGIVVGIGVFFFAYAVWLSWDAPRCPYCSVRDHNAR
jgi:hypothetical protein